MPAHAKEVLSLAYSPSNPALLASGSRDRLIHVFENVDKDFDLTQTIEVHK